MDRLILNGVMLISIPVDGGHYFIDMLAGLGIAILCLVAARIVVACLAAHSAPAKAAFGPVSAPEVAAPTG